MCLFGVATASQQVVAARQKTSCVFEKDVLNVPSAAVTIAARRLWESVFTMTENVSGSLLRPAAAAPELWTMTRNTVNFLHFLSDAVGGGVRKD